MRLSDAIDEYHQSRRNAGFARNTLRSDQQGLNLLLVTLGNIPVRSMDSKHGEMFAVAMSSKNLQPATANLYRGVFMRFCKWAAMRKYLPSTANPLGITRNLRVIVKPRRRVPSKEFARLLDAAGHPQGRIIVALGLYLFLRSSEVADLDVEHVNLDEGFVLVFQRKTGRWDQMPISKRLDAELRRWLTWYAQDVAETKGPLQPHWPLVPARTQSSLENDGSGKCGGRPVLPVVGQMNPPRRVGQPHKKVQLALRGIGWEVEPGDREGGHTLRRSGARALYDYLVSTDGRARDDAIGMVQAMLHHKTRSQTEHYIGLEAEVEKRDVLLRGADMFGEDELAENVVSITAVEA